MEYWEYFGLSRDVYIEYRSGPRLLLGIVAGLVTAKNRKPTPSSQIVQRTTTSVRVEAELRPG